MLRKVITLLILFCATHNGFAQHTGCFKRAAGKLILEPGTELSQADTWLIGELHGVYGTSEIKLALIRYLHDHNSISDVFMEMSFSSAWLYNRYLQTGDTTLFTNPYLVYSYRKPNREFWKQLYAYNKTLKDKITIHGMDFERLEFIKVLKLLKPANTFAPEQIVATLKRIDTATISNINDTRFITLYEQIRENVSQHREAYKRYYGDNFAIVERILFNANTRAAFSRRNETMFENVRKQLEQQNIKKFIVFTGLNHADKSSDSSLCGRLDHYLGGRLTTVAMICKECYDWQLPPNERHVPFKAPITYVNDQILLNGIYSRFSDDQCAYSLVNTANTDDKRVRASSNYLILMREQPEF